MAILNLLQLLQSDDQNTFTDKINYNLDQIISMGGGPIGPTGFTGIQGVPGNQGVQGFQGDPGLDGSRWYVLPSTSTPINPTPKLNDLWLQTDTLHIFEYLGSPAIWVDLGYTLAAPGPFKIESNDVLFTYTTPTRALVISPIDYGPGNSSPNSSYKLKIVGNSAAPMLRFAIDDGGAENPVSVQSTIGIQKITDVAYIGGINWKTIFSNNGGDFNINTSGNYFTIYPHISSVSKFDFGGQTKIQNTNSARLISFTGLNTGDEFFNIGRHNGIINDPDNLFTINDKGQVGFNNNEGTAFVLPIGANDFHIDVLNEPLNINAFDKTNWFRLRGKTKDDWDSLQIDHNRLWSDNSAEARSAMIRLQHYTSTTLNHFIGFTGGSDNNTQNILRPQLRFGVIDDYYFSGDINGRIGIGDTAFIQKYNSATTNFKTKLQIQGNDIASGGLSTTGFNAFSGIHLIPQNFTGGSVGISAGGIGNFENDTYAGIHFQDQSGTADQGIDMHLNTGLYSNGSIRRFTIDRNGDSRFYAKGNPWHVLFIEPGGLSGGGNTYTTDFMKIGSFDWASNGWKSITFLDGSDNTGFGDGFLGIGGGSGFGDDITSGSLEQNMWYLAKGPVVYMDGSSISVNSGVSFKVTGASATLTSGTVSRAKPATKLHVAQDGVTFGTRKGGAGFSTYSGNVGQNSFTVGNTHKASGIRSIILGGAEHTVTGNDTTLIGFSGSGITVPDANIVQLGTVTHVSKFSPFSPTSSELYTNGNGSPIPIGVFPQWSIASNPIMYLSSKITAPAPISPLLGRRGYTSRILSLEAVSDSANLQNIHAAMEFSVRNSLGVSQQIGMVSGHYYSAGTGANRGRISFSIFHDARLHERAYVHSGGFNLVPAYAATGNALKNKISVEENLDTTTPSGHSIALEGGKGNQGVASTGGSVSIDGGVGGAGGATGNVYIGYISTTPVVAIGNTAATVSILGNAQILQGTGPGTPPGGSGTPGAWPAVTGGPGSMPSITLTYNNGFGGVDATGAAISVTPTNTYLNLQGFELNSGQVRGVGATLFHFNINPVPYDRMITWWGAGSWNSATSRIEMQTKYGTYPANTTHPPIDRAVTNPYGGGNFLIPANQSRWVYFQVFGITSAGNDPSLVTSGTSAFIFREIKFGQ